MKSIKLFLILFSILLFTINSLTSSSIVYINDARQNVTILPIDLENVDLDYIYYYFDFVAHSELFPENKDTAYLSILLDEESYNMIRNDSVKFILNDLNISETEIKDIKDLDWKETRIVYKKDMEYFYTIKRNKEKSLFLRVATNNVKKGQVIATNVEKIPSDDSDNSDNSDNSIAGNIKISSVIWIFFLILNIW